MNATARDFNQVTPADTNGLDDLFVEGAAQDTPAQVIEVAQDRTPQDRTEAQDNPGQDWTISEAARTLGISEKTVLRRLQRGALHGYKVSGQFGAEWRVGRTAQDTPAQDTPAQVIEVAQDRTPQDKTEAQDSPGQDGVILELKEEIAALRNQLEGAIYRNGYLEAKLEDRESTIKLLTDSQHKRGWWAKFSSWFFQAR